MPRRSPKDGRLEGSIWNMSRRKQIRRYEKKRQYCLKNNLKSRVITIKNDNEAKQYGIKPADLNFLSQMANNFEGKP